MCDGRPFTSPLFRRPAGRGVLYRGFPFRWVLHFVLSLTRGVIVHDSASCSREDSRNERVGPCDTLSCFFFSALWLQRSQSILVQEIQSAKDIDVTCFNTFPIKAATCLQVGPMSLDWPVDPFARFDQSRPSSSPEDPIVDQQRGAFQASTRFRWRQDALQPPQALQGIAGGDACGPFFSEGMRCVTWNTRGLVGSVFSKQKKREFKLKYLKSLFDANNILCHQEVHGKDEYLQAIQVMAPRFRLFGAFLLDNENAGGSAICIHRDLLPEEAIVPHLITCQGRDHIVNIQSGRQSLVIVNVHFEPELTLRHLRGRLRLIIPRWPSYPNAVGIILGDFNICEPKEGRFNVWNQTFTDGDPRKTALFHSFFPHVLEIAQPDYTRKDSTALGIIRTLSGGDRIFINLPMAEARDFRCYSHVFDNLGNRTIPSDHAAVRLVIHKPTTREQSCKRIPS